MKLPMMPYKYLKRTLVTLLLTQVATVQAYTDAEIDQMIKALKEENQELRKEVQRLQRQQDQNTADKLIERPVSRSSQSEQQINSVKRSIESQDNNFKINGFLTAAATTADPAVYNQTSSYDDDIAFDNESIVGLQTSFNVNEITDVTVQMVARGEENWNLEAEWAFVRYSPTDDLSLRAGRLRLPLYLFSESLEVGFSYPWVRPPSEVYALPISNFEGIDLLYTLPSGDWFHQLQVFTGQDKGDGYETDDFYGANITSTTGPWTVRASAFTFDIEFSKFAEFIPAENIEDGGSYYTLAGMYDDSNWLVVSELYVYDTKETIAFRDTEAGYITIGKYINDWLPYFTYAKAYTTNEPDSPLSRFVNFTNTSYTVGARYNMTANTSAKFEWNHYTDLDDTGGIWNGLAFSDRAEGIEDIDIYSIVLDVVF